MKYFAIIGVAGFVAPRHLAAIKETGNQLVAACDISDSVGIIDRYFSQADFFTSYERFERFLHKRVASGRPLDYLVVCTPNYLHDTHIRLGLALDVDVICEKPVSINPWNVEALIKNQLDSKGRIYNILQMRLHPVLKDLHKATNSIEPTKAKLTYITSRGKWYYASWKGDEAKSGGICVNIGIHFFDLLIHLFGDVQSLKVYQRTHDRASGVLFFDRAEVSWYLSINENTLNQISNDNQNQTAYRGIQIGSQDFNFTSGFEDLHYKSYEDILDGRGFSIDEALPSIALVHQIRNAELSAVDDHSHELTKMPQGDHPFK